MHGIDLDRLEKLAEGLGLFFGVFMFMAFVIALAGEAGSAFLLLLLGAAAHVGQAGLVEFAARERSRDRLSAPQRQAQSSRVVERPARVRRAA